MIIYKDKSVQINGIFPDSKYDDTADYWVEDDSEIAKFILESKGKFDILEYDETGKILKVTERYPIDDMKEDKKQEINNDCSSVIYSGYEYNGEHYDLNDEDQINMLAWSAVAQQGKSVPYHSSGNPCRIYTAEEFLDLVTAVTSFKTYNLTYCNLLKLQVDEMTEKEDIASVKYGVTALSKKYQTILDSIIGGDDYENEKSEDNQTSADNVEESDTI